MDTLMEELQFFVERLITKQDDQRVRGLSKDMTREFPEQIDLKDDVEKSLHTCKLIIKSTNDNEQRNYAKFIKAVCHTQRNEWDDAIELLKELGYSDFWIYKQKNDNLNNALISYYLKEYNVVKDDFYDMYFSSCYKIHSHIFEIMNRLIVEDKDLEVSHYTRLSTAEILLFKKSPEKSPLRMCSMATANDSSEGSVIFEYLGHQEWFGKLCEEINARLQCFVACFTFDSECLNQFRLYGKENQKEATGISLCFRVKSFDHSISNQFRFKVKEEFCNEYYRSPLYRCLYINPLQKSIISFGYGATSEDKDWVEKNRIAIEGIMEELQNSIDEFIEMKELLNNMDEFNKISDDKDRRINIVSNTLLNLSYIVKHAAFKEEQECRVFSIQKLRGANHILFCEKSRNIYMNYNLPMKELKEIIFAPKTSDFLLFKDRLDRDPEYENVICRRSTLPIA